MPEPDIRVFLQNLKGLIDSNSQFFFTFTPAEKGQFERLRIKDFYYPIDEMRQICESEGYRFEMAENWNYKEGGDRAARLVLAENAAANS